MKEKKSRSFFISLFKWKMSGEELKNQIENYNSLGFFRSARKVATALLILSIVITLILGLFEVVPLEEIWLDIIILAVLAFFVYKGKKVAIILAMVYWTFSKGYQLVSNPQQALMAIIWWLIYMSVFYQAYQIEKARKDITKEKETMGLAAKESVVNYCPNCGNEIRENVNFCARCGRRIK